jgi:hypothetical protein
MLELRQRLASDAGPHGWTLLILDPLVRWAGPDVETDNAMATRFVQSLETLTNVPGRPFVLMNHHSSKEARRGGSVDSRGVTAITDNMRWTFEMRSEGGDVYVRQKKSNYSMPMLDELRLVREQGGLLRALTNAELAERTVKAEEKKAATVKERFEADVTLLERLLPEEPRTASVTDLEATLASHGAGWGQKRLTTALAALDREGRIRDLSDGRRSCPRAWCRVVTGKGPTS